MEKEDIIDNFLDTLRNKSANEFGKDTGKEIQDVFSKHFSVFCRKCGSGDIYLNFEDGIDYGGYTGYSEGQKVIKCKQCGNAASYWE